MVYSAPDMRSVLLSWSDRDQISAERAEKRGKGPIRRLLQQRSFKRHYDAIWLLSSSSGEAAAHQLREELLRRVALVEVRVVDVDDPSDPEQVLVGLGELLEHFEQRFAETEWQRDVLISAGGPAIFGAWLMFTQAGLLKTRLLRVDLAGGDRVVDQVSFDFPPVPAVQLLHDQLAALRARLTLLDSQRLIARSAAMGALVERISATASSALPLLLYGESGSGKRRVAEAIHQASARQGLFVCERCSGLSGEQLELALFGGAAGAYPTRRRSAFERARGGTLYLADLDALPAELQTQLLRLLDDRLLRIGSTVRDLPIDVRLIVGSSSSLEAAVEAGRFRRELLHRLAGVTLTVPALRQRREDIPELIQQFVGEFHRRPCSISPGALRALERYSFPGNVRQLQLEVARWHAFGDGVVDLDRLSAEIVAAANEPPASPAVPPSAQSALAHAVNDAEFLAIRAALQAHNGNLSRTASTLAIDRNTLKRKMQRFGLR
ncbi:MAG: sigma-54-dependent Fis family transcriptional regulator [Deltaproteobacteria bacterium]|nr:sigma-54-dependent Fis family transcriptional regulator [Deltaproteobacteria bacterium]